MNIDTVLKTNFVKALIGQVCGSDTKLVSRDQSYAVCNKHEGERDIHRVILLPPRGFTANAIDQMNSHDEAEHATIEVKGAIRSGKDGFSKMKDALLVVSQNENGEVSDLDQPYLTFNIQAPAAELALKKHPAGGAPFTVTKSDGFGFYHNLINLTDEWLALRLRKTLRPQKAVNLEQALIHLPQQQACALRDFYEAVVRHGDNIFKKAPQTVDAVTSLPTENSLPALGEMLFVHDSGRHEACTVFAVILKIGNKHPNITTQFLKDATLKESVPVYYTKQLLHKIKRKSDKLNQRMPEVA